MILLKDVTIVDSRSRFNGEKKDILLKNGKILYIASIIQEDTARVIAIEGLHVSIGWFDSSVSFGEPGFEERQTLEQGLKVAAKSGFTTIMLNPNNQPNPVDKTGIHFLKNATSGNAVTVYPVGNLTLDKKGEHLAELYDMHQAGALSFYDFKKATANTNLMKIALQYTKTFAGVVQSYPEDQSLSGSGVVNEDTNTAHLGLRTIPSMAEDLQVYRDIQLAAYTNGRLHIPTITTNASAIIIANAKKQKLAVSCSVSINNLALNSSSLAGFDSHFKLEPPLRDIQEQQALITHVKKGTIDMVTSDHIPLNIEHKDVEFDQATAGSIGLESAFAVMLELVGLDTTITQFTNAYDVFNIKKPQIEENVVANLSLFTISENGTFDSDAIKSTTKNSALLGVKTKGKAIGIYNNGKLVLA